MWVSFCFTAAWSVASEVGREADLESFLASSKAKRPMLRRSPSSSSEGAATVFTPESQSAVGLRLLKDWGGINRDSLRSKFEGVSVWSYTILDHLLLLSSPSVGFWT